MIVWLDKQGLAHSSANPFKEVIDGVERIHWVTFDLDIPPIGTTIFVFDYKDRKSIEEGRNKASLRLRNSDKCHLRIQALREIVLTLEDFEHGIRLWSDLLGPERQVLPGRFDFLEGPAIKMIPSTEDSIFEIVLVVSSLIKTKKALLSKNLLGAPRNDKLTINKAAVQGLNISFTEEC